MTSYHNSHGLFTTKNFSNTNGTTDGIKLVGNLQCFLLKKYFIAMSLLIYTNKKFSLVYTEEITVRMKRKEKIIKMCHHYKRFYRQNKVIANIYW